MKDIEILEDEKTNDSNETIKLPANFIIIGEADVNDVKVYIKQDVYKEIEKFSKADTTCERGGILVGDYAEVNNKKNVIISAFIEAKYTDASASTLTFTHETWNYIHNQQESLYPDKKILGWQHTHPNYGIFLSNYDIFIQKNFFNLPWQIAYVVDPIAGTRGFFQWRNDKIEKTSGFYIYDDVDEKIKIKQVKSSKKVNLFSIIAVYLLVILFALTLYLGIERFNTNQELNELIDTNAEISKEKEELGEKLQESDKLVEQLQQNDHSSKSGNVINNTNTAETTKKSDESANDTVKLKVYTIQDGDTLNTICNKLNIDYVENKSVILKMNGIANENKIYSGERLYLPLN